MMKSGEDLGVGLTHPETGNNQHPVSHKLPNTTIITVCTPFLSHSHISEILHVTPRPAPSQLAV